MKQAAALLYKILVVILVCHEVHVLFVKRIDTGSFAGCLEEVGILFFLQCFNKICLVSEVFFE